MRIHVTHVAPALHRREAADFWQRQDTGREAAGIFEAISLSGAENFSKTRASRAGRFALAGSYKKLPPSSAAWPSPHRSRLSVALWVFYVNPHKISFMWILRVLYVTLCRKFYVTLHAGLKFT